MKIAIADDSGLLRERVKSALSGIKNVEVVGEATNGIDALQMIIDKDPDYMILDLRMPGLNGISVLMKSREYESKCKICILTNYAYTPYKERCFSEGAHYFFDKNLDFGRMVKIISDLANRGVALII
ncbi:MAG: response regulator transcription factor [Bacteroidales bacterium]